MIGAEYVDGLEALHIGAREYADSVGMEIEIVPISPDVSGAVEQLTSERPEAVMFGMAPRLGPDERSAFFAAMASAAVPVASLDGHPRRTPRCARRSLPRHRSEDGASHRAEPEPADPRNRRLRAARPHQRGGEAARERSHRGGASLRSERRGPARSPTSSSRRRSSATRAR